MQLPLMANLIGCCFVVTILIIFVREPNGIVNHQTTRSERTRTGMCSLPSCSLGQAGLVNTRVSMAGRGWARVSSGRSDSFDRSVLFATPVVEFFFGYVSPES